MKKLIFINIIFLISISFFSCNNEPDVDLILNNLHDYESEGYVPTNPQNISFIHTSEDSIVIEWKDKSVGESGFRIEKGAGNQDYKVIGFVATNITQFTDTTLLKMNVTYHYRVLATFRDTIGIGTEANSAYIYMHLATPYFKVIKNNWTNVESNNAFIFWEDNSNAEEGYILSKSVNGKQFDILDSLPKNSNSYIDYGLDSMNTQQYKIQAFSKRSITISRSELEIKRGVFFNPVNSQTSLGFTRKTIFLPNNEVKALRIQGLGHSNAKLKLCNFDSQGNKISELDQDFDFDQQKGFDLSATGKLIAIPRNVENSTKYEIAIYSGLNGELLKTLPCENFTPGKIVKFSQDEKFLIVSNASAPTGHLFDLGENKYLRSLENMSDLKISKSGEIAVSYYYGFLHLWDTNDWTLIKKFNTGTNILDIGISNDGKLIASTSAASNQISIWNEIGSKIHTIESEAKGFTLFSPNNNILFVGTSAFYINDPNSINRMNYEKIPTDFNNNGTKAVAYDYKEGGTQRLHTVSYDWNVSLINHL